MLIFQYDTAFYIGREMALSPFHNRNEMKLQVQAKSESADYKGFFHRKKRGQ